MATTPACRIRRLRKSERALELECSRLALELSVAQGKLEIVREMLDRAGLNAADATPFQGDDGGNGVGAVEHVIADFLTEGQPPQEEPRIDNAGAGGAQGKAGVDRETTGAAIAAELSAMAVERPDDAGGAQVEARAEAPGAEVGAVAAPSQQSASPTPPTCVTCLLDFEEGEEQYSMPCCGAVTHLQCIAICLTRQKVL